MRVRIRKKQYDNPMRNKSNIFEWSVKPNNWYPISRKNLLTPVNGDSVIEHNTRVRDFFNALILGLVVTAEAKYDRSTHQMEVKL